MKVLVTGASGFIGRHAVREALGRGHCVVAMSRSPSATTGERQGGLEQLSADLSLGSELNLNDMGIDVVVHLAASMSGTWNEQYSSTVLGTEALLEGMRRANISKLIGVSSIAVLDYANACPLSVIDESTPLSGDESGMGTYASIKARQEALFSSFAAEPGHHSMILRPGLVYDSTVLMNSHAGIVKGPLRLLATHDGEVPVVEVSGVARAIVDAVEREFDNGQVIQLVDDRLPRQQDYLAALRRRGRLAEGGILIPWRMMSALAGMSYRVACISGLRGKLPEAVLPQSLAGRMKPFRYSNARARSTLGWVPTDRFS